MALKRIIAFLLLISTVAISLAACTSAVLQDEGSSESTAEQNTDDAPITTQTPTVTTEAPPPPVSEAKITSFTVSKNNNRNMCEDIEGVITEDTITLTVSAPTDSYSLKNASIDVESDGVSVSFSTADGDRVDLLSADCCYCTVTDDLGLTRTYTVKVNYAEGLIPVISIDTASGLDITTKEDYVDAVISIDAAGVDSWYLPEDFASLEPTEIGIKGRGNSTWGWPKKPYKIKFDSKTSVLGMTKAKKWVLLANYSDYSLMRNSLALEVAKVVSDELSHFSTYPVNLFVNGVYRGVYSIGEDHEVGDGRIELPENDGSPDSSFVLEVGGYEDGEDIYDLTYFSTELIRFCSIEYPEDGDITSEQAKFIKNYVKNADNAVKSLSGYEEYIDVDALIDWFIINELFYNLESVFRRSCFLTKEVGGKLKMGPIWDFDLAMGNLYNDYGKYDIWAAEAQEYGYVGDNWMCYLLDDPTFRAKLKTRWEQVKGELLSSATEYIDKMRVTLSISAEYNFRVWKILGTRCVAPQPKYVANYKTYQSNVDYLRSFIVNRFNWRDKNI